MSCSLLIPWYLIQPGKTRVNGKVNVQVKFKKVKLVSALLSSVPLCHTETISAFSFVDDITSTNGNMFSMTIVCLYMFVINVF